jgi:hypothetical protein
MKKRVLWRAKKLKKLRRVRRDQTSFFLRLYQYHSFAIRIKNRENFMKQSKTLLFVLHKFFLLLRLKMHTKIQLKKVCIFYTSLIFFYTHTFVYFFFTDNCFVSLVLVMPKSHKKLLPFFTSLRYY